MPPARNPGVNLATIRTDEDPNRLSYWHPLLKAAGVPTPRTATVELTRTAQIALIQRVNGAEVEEPDVLAREVDVVATSLAMMGSPAFLRTDFTSGKHSWRRTCFVEDAGRALSHMVAIGEYSEMADFLGLPYRTWHIREYLDVEPLGTCPEYDGMPVLIEYRCFVEDGNVLCAHPYWPQQALEEGGAGQIDYAAACREQDLVGVMDLARAASDAVPGAWSVDVLLTRKGWYVTDMALAAQSWHDPACANRTSPRANRLYPPNPHLGEGDTTDPALMAFVAEAIEPLVA